MTNTFTLDDLRSATKKKYDPVLITLSDGTDAELLSLLRLKATARESVLDTVKDIKTLGEGDEDELDNTEKELLIESLSGIFRTISGKYADQLLAELHEDDVDIKLDLMMQVLTRWLAGAKVGEALSSPS